MPYALELATTPRGGDQLRADAAVDRRVPFSWTRRILIFAGIVLGLWLLGALLGHSSASAATPAKPLAKTADSTRHDALVSALVTRLGATTTQVRDTVGAVTHAHRAAVGQHAAKTARIVEKTVTNTVHSVTTTLTSPLQHVTVPVVSSPPALTVASPSAPVRVKATSPGPRAVPAVAHGAAVPTAQTRFIATSATMNSESGARRSAARHESSMTVTQRRDATTAVQRAPQPTVPTRPALPTPDKGIMSGAAGSARSAENNDDALGSAAPLTAQAAALERVLRAESTLTGATNACPDVSPD